MIRRVSSTLVRHVSSGELRQLGRCCLDLLFPRRCPSCQHDLAESGAPLCAACDGNLRQARVSRCAHCGARTAKPVDAGACDACRADNLPFDSVWPLGNYDGLLRQLVLRMKREPALALVVGDLVWRELGTQLVRLEYDLLVPVPMHWRRRLLRGMNGPELLAERLATHLSRPDRPRIVSRQRNTEPQGMLSPAERFRNLRGAFRLGRGADASRRETAASGRHPHHRRDGW